MLEQGQDGGCLYPAAYASRSLNRHEKNYGITELGGGSWLGLDEVCCCLFFSPPAVLTPDSPPPA